MTMFRQNLKNNLKNEIMRNDINDRWLTTMINFDAINNFMTKALVERKEYSTQKKLDAYNLIIVDKNLLLARNERMSKETKSLSIAI